METICLFVQLRILIGELQIYSMLVHFARSQLALMSLGLSFINRYFSILKFDQAYDFLERIVTLLNKRIRTLNRQSNRLKMRLRNTIHNNKHIRLIPRDLHKIILLRNPSLSLIQQHPLTLSDKVVIHRSHMVLHPRSRAHTIILVPRREIIMRPRQSQPIIKSRHILPSILRPPPPNRLMLILLPRG